MDKGFGKFGSTEWHKNNINDLSSVAEIGDYIYGLLGEKLEDGSLPEVKDRAIKIIEAI